MKYLNLKSLFSGDFGVVRGWKCRTDGASSLRKVPRLCACSAPRHNDAADTVFRKSACKLVVKDMPVRRIVHGERRDRLCSDYVGRGDEAEPILWSRRVEGFVGRMIRAAGDRGSAAGKLSSFKPFISSSQVSWVPNCYLASLSMGECSVDLVLPNQASITDF